MYQQSEENYHLQQTKQNLTFENNELKNQLLLLEDRTQNAGTEKLRRQLESEYEPILE